MLSRSKAAISCGNSLYPEIRLKPFSTSSNANASIVWLDLFRLEIESHGTSYLLNDATVAGAENWQSATNFHLRDEDNPVAQCPRFARLKETLSATDPVDLKPMDLLSKVANGSTQWSAVYYPGQGQVDVVMGRDYEHPLKFDLNEKANFGQPRLGVE